MRALSLVRRAFPATTGDPTHARALLALRACQGIASLCLCSRFHLLHAYICPTLTTPRVSWWGAVLIAQAKSTARRRVLCDAQGPRPVGASCRLRCGAVVTVSRSPRVCQDRPQLEWCVARKYLADK